MRVQADIPPYRSPLFMVMNDPVMHQLISYVAARRANRRPTPITTFESNCRAAYWPRRRNRSGSES